MSVAQSNVSSNTHKRPRLEEGDEESTWTRHPNLYMQDGTIVLVAKDTVFRVYSGLLCKHSEVFSGMCSLSSHQPSNAEIYDGCPLVRLSDDPEDMAYFLNVLLDFSFFPEQNHPVTYGVVAGTLRLATKYMVQPLRDKAIAHLYRAYPPNFDQLMKHREITPQVFGQNDHPHPFDLIALLRECGVEKILPQAFVLACNRGFNELVKGGLLQGKYVFLSPEDARIALLGWQHIRELVCQIINKLEAELDPHCLSLRCSTEARGRFTRGVLTWVSTHRSLNLTFPWKRLVLCHVCIGVLERKFNEEILGIWKNVPAAFGLRSWEQLEGGV